MKTSNNSHVLAHILATKRIKKLLQKTVNINNIVPATRIKAVEESLLVKLQKVTKMQHPNQKLVLVGKSLSVLLRTPQPRIQYLYQEQKRFFLT